MNALRLPGCSPTPLAHYLKALGIVRLLSEQLPPDAPRPRGAWGGESFVLHTHLDREGLERFFLHDYRPTPILDPWNGGSGFYFREGKLKETDAAGKRIKTGERTEATEATKTIDRIVALESPRFDSVKNCIGICRDIVRGLGFSAAPKEEEKADLLLRIRSALPADYLDVIDAAYVLLGDEAKPPPLLGTGLNDGNLDFSSNFLQRLMEVFEFPSGTPAPAAAQLLNLALYREAAPVLVRGTFGQFDPAASGGANNGSGFSGHSATNPWDFILMLEGALLFASAAVKRLGATGGGELAYPFSVRPSGFGYASASSADGDGARCELWVPLWDQPASLTELRQVLGEGRAQLRDRAARDGFEFGRAVVRLGVDRGLTAFQRYSFQPRNGLAFFATPLDRIPVRRRQRVSELLDDLDKNNWLDTVRSRARGDRVPNRVASAVRQLETAALALCRSSQLEAEEFAAVEAVLLAVADAEAALARSLNWTLEKGLRPIPQLTSAWWWKLKRRSSFREFDLAASLASLAGPLLRVHWEPLNTDLARSIERPFAGWDKLSREVVWHDSQFVTTLIDVHLRRLLLTSDESDSFQAVYFARPRSIAAFLDCETDDARLGRLTRALSLVKIPMSARSHAGGAKQLPALFALPRLALAGNAPESREPMPRVAAILRRGDAGDGLAATRLAAQRLRGSGFTPALREVPAHGESVRRAVAATLFPLSPLALAALAEHFRPLTTTAVVA